MTTVFDNRIVQVTIDFEDGAQTFEGLSIYATGEKFTAAANASCEFRIYNLTEEQRNYILFRTTPFNTHRFPVKVSLDVGRESYGTFRLFDGYVNAGGITPPPDIGIVLSAITNNIAVALSTVEVQSSTVQLSTIAQRIATGLGKKLDFQATDKTIENYFYNASTAFQIQKLNEMGNVIAFLDGDSMVVLNSGIPRTGVVRDINATTGMIGIPQLTPKGVMVKMMLDNSIELGRLVHVESKVLPVANGDYVVERILFDVASRDQPFWYTLDCKVPQYYGGTIS